jgi:hypothetical protein
MLANQTTVAAFVFPQKGATPALGGFGVVLDPRLSFR